MSLRVVRATASLWQHQSVGPLTPGSSQLSAWALLHIHPFPQAQVVGRQEFTSFAHQSWGNSSSYTHPDGARHTLSLSKS